MERDLWFLSGGGRIAKRKAGLLCAPLEDGWLVLVLFEGCMGSAANCSGLGGNCRQMAEALGVGRPRGLAGGVWVCQQAARKPMVADRGGKRQ